MSQVSYGQMTIADLTDNYQVQLSPESASFAGGTSSAKDGNITVIVSTLQGNKRIAHTIGTPSGLPSGMTVTNKTNGTASADGSFRINVTTSLISTSGYFTIPITVDGVVYNRRFSYSVGRDGTSPTVTETQVRYHQSTNGTTPSTTESDWVTPAPTAIAGQYMWTRTVVTYSDNATTISYSVSKNGADGTSVSNVTSSKSGDTTTITITYSDGRTPSTFTVNDGAVGATAQWYYGSDLTHTSGTADISTTLTDGVVVGSMYLNPDTSLCYRCTNISGTTATWTYAGDLTTGVFTAVDNFLTQREIFNRLTNNQTNQGVYLDGTNLYINATMIQSGVFTVPDPEDPNGDPLFQAGQGAVIIKALNKLGMYFEFGDDGVIIGKQDSNMKLRLTNDEMGFYQGDNKVAYINSDKLHITNANIVSSLALGNFAFIPQSNGNLSFRKVK